MTPLSPSSWDHCRQCSQDRALFHSVVSPHLACFVTDVRLLRVTTQGYKGLLLALCAHYAQRAPIDPHLIIPCTPIPNPLLHALMYLP